MFALGDRYPDSLGERAGEEEGQGEGKEPHGAVGDKEGGEKGATRRSGSREHKPGETVLCRGRTRESLG